MRKSRATGLRPTLHHISISLQQWPLQPPLPRSSLPQSTTMLRSLPFNLPTSSAETPPLPQPPTAPAPAPSTRTASTTAASSPSSPSSASPSSSSASGSSSGPRTAASSGARATGMTTSRPSYGARAPTAPP